MQGDLKFRLAVSKYINLEIDFLFPLVLSVLFIAGFITEYLVFFVFILLHEAGHMIPALLLGQRRFLIRFLPAGINIRMDVSLYGRSGRIAVYLGGPAVNISAAVLCLPVVVYNLLPNGIAFDCLLINIFLAVFNLIPVIPLDGACLLGELLALEKGHFMAGRRMRKISLAVSSVLTAAGIVLFFFYPRNISLVLAGVYMFCAAGNRQAADDAYAGIRTISGKQSRIKTKGVYPVKTITALKTVRLGAILKNIDSDRFHIIYVLDENLRLYEILTEQDIMDGMMKHSTALTLEELTGIEKTRDMNYNDSKSSERSRKHNGED